MKGECTYAEHSETLAQAGIALCDLLEGLVALEVAFDEGAVYLLLQEYKHLREGSKWCITMQ
jgi:hypothetical protein